jgi:hypothetical protein
MLSKYVYKSEFMSDNKDEKCIDMDNFNPDTQIKSDSPLIYHVYNDKRVKVFKIIYHSFIEFIIFML